MAHLDRKQLLGSKWTAVDPSDRDKHFQVTGLPRTQGQRTDPPSVTLRALLSGRERSVALDALTDPAEWKPGWR